MRNYLVLFSIFLTGNLLVLNGMELPTKPLVSNDSLQNNSNSSGVFAQPFKKGPYGISWHPQGVYCIIHSLSEGVSVLDAVANKLIPLNNNNPDRFLSSAYAFEGFVVRSNNPVVRHAWWTVTGELVAVCDDSYIRTLSVPKDMFTREYTQLKSDVKNYFISGDGLKLIAIDQKGQARLLNLSTGLSKKIDKVKNKKEVKNIVWSPTSDICALIVDTDLLLLVDTIKGKTLLTLEHKEPIIAVLWDTTGTACSILSSSMIKVISLKNIKEPIKNVDFTEISLKPYGVLAGCWGQNQAVIGVITTDDKFLLVNLVNKEIKEVNDVSKENAEVILLNARLRNLVARSRSRIYKESFSHDGTKLAYINDKKMIIRNVCTFSTLATFNAKASPRVGKWSPDNTKIVLNDKCHVVVYDTNTRKVIANFTHTSPLRKLEWSPDGSQLITLSDAEIQQFSFLR